MRYASGGSDELALALRAHRKGRTDEALEAYRRAVARAPDDLDAWMNLGSLLASVGSASGARDAFANARAERDPRALRDVGFGLAHVGELDLARRAFEQALARDALLVGARLGLARICAELGDRDAGLVHARRAVADAPREASTHLELHRALFDDRDLAPCIEAAQRAVALDPGYALARYFLGAALVRAGRPDDAFVALGGDGLVDPGLVDALWYCAPRGREVRCFATKRETLLFALSLAPPAGPVVELGVRHGVSTRVLAGATQGIVHGFDSFAGLPEAWQSRPSGVFSTAGELPAVPSNVRLHPGLFADTLPGFVASLAEPPRLVHIDSDLYSSAAEALTLLGPHIARGSVIVLDEYVGNGSFRDDEHRALHEAAARFGWRLVERSLGWITGQGVVLVE